MSEKEDPFNIEAPSASDVVDTISTSAELYASLTFSFMQEFTFDNLTLKEWADQMTIKFDREMDEAGFRKKLTELAENYQTASNYYSIASAIEHAVSGGSGIKKNDLCRALVATFHEKNGRRPAAAMIERMAESYMHSTVSTQVASRIVKNFWKQRLDTLTELRKVFEQIGMSMHVELKFTGQ